MGVLKWFCITVVCGVVGVCVVEEPRFQGTYSFCERKDYRNNLLLRSDVCKDDYTRAELDGHHVSCTRAQEEVNLGIWRCAVRKWWQEGEPAALYDRVLGSPYMIYALLMPSIMFVIYQVFAYCGEARRENKWFQEQQSFAQSVMQIQAQQQKQYYSPPPRIRYVSSHAPIKQHKLTNREMRSMRSSSWSDEE